MRPAVEMNKKQFITVLGEEHQISEKFYTMKKNFIQYLLIMIHHFKYSLYYVVLQELLQFS